MLIHFTATKLELSAIGGDSIVSFDYRTDGNVIIIDDTTKAFRIIHLSKDSLTLQIGESVEVLFMPLSPSSSSMNKQKLNADLLRYSWNRTEGEWKDRLDFLRPSADENSVAPKRCLRFHQRKYSIDRVAERWALSEFHGAVLLGLSHAYTETNIYQFQDFNGTELKAEHLTKGGKTRTIFKAIKPLEEAKRNQLISILTSKPWIVRHIEHHNRFRDVYGEDDTTRYSGSGLAADTLLLRTDFLYKKLVYSFSADRTFSIFVDNEDEVNGRWSVTPDGQFIIAGNPMNPQAYLEVIKATPDQLTVGQCIWLRLSPEKLNFIEYDCKIEMK